MSAHVTLALAATAVLALSASAFAQGHGRGPGGGGPPGRGGGGGGLVTQGGGGGGGGGGFVAPNIATSGGTYVQGGGSYTPRPDYRYDSRRYRHRPGTWWGPVVGFGIGAGYPYWGGYGYGWADYYYPSYDYGYADFGNFCATRVRTCQLYEPAPVGARCSCRVPGGRAVGQVVP